LLELVNDFEKEEKRRKRGSGPGRSFKEREFLQEAYLKTMGLFMHYALVGTNVKYAPIHQFGGRAGKGHRARIPARPFLSLTDEDKDEIVEVLKGFLDSL
jgi:phage virion morphogenesis protein